MIRFLLTVACATLAGVRGHAADALYHNIATVPCDSAPQIDATVFVNDGSFCAVPITGSLLGANGGIPYMTQNTLWFTNNNLMQSGPGFWLDYVGADGLHRPAAAIVNSAGGANGPSTIFGTEFMLLSASNLVNKGILEISAAGLMQLSGGNVDLSYGGLLVEASSSGGLCVEGVCVPDNQFRFYMNSTNFFPISGLVADVYWGVGTLMTMASAQIANQRGSSVVVQSPFHTVTNLSSPFGFGARLGPISNPQTFVRTNALSPRNWNV